MTNGIVKYEADFVFIKGGNNVYFIEKDRYKWLNMFLALDEPSMKMFLDSEFKTTVLNTRGDVIMQNFKDVDMKVVQSLLVSIEKSYEARLQLLAEIDIALDEGNKELFVVLTEKLRQLDVGGVIDEHGVA